MIVHQPTRNWAPERDNPIYTDINFARLKQNLETPLSERIEYATWPETVLYFSTLTMDGRYSTRQVKELYQYSFREYLGQWKDLDPDKQPTPLNEDPQLSEYQLERLDDLRFGIKKDRDKHFVENQYDDLGVTGVPKSFWLTEYELTREQSEPDDFAQSALDHFATEETD